MVELTIVEHPTCLVLYYIKMKMKNLLLMCISKLSRMECQQVEMINLAKIEVFVKLLQIVGSSKFVPRIGGVTSTTTIQVDSFPSRLIQ